MCADLADHRGRDGPPQSEHAERGEFGEHVAAAAAWLVDQAGDQAVVGPVAQRAGRDVEHGACVFGAAPSPFGVADGHSEPADTDTAGIVPIGGCGARQVDVSQDRSRTKRPYRRAPR